jgi:hypothetical protein
MVKAGRVTTLVIISENTYLLSRRIPHSPQQPSRRSKGLSHGLKSYLLPVIPTKSSIAQKDTNPVVFGSTPVRFPHLPVLNRLMRESRLAENFDAANDPVLEKESQFYELLNSYTGAKKKKESWVVEHANRMEVDKCTGYKYLVWTSADGIPDARCYKCSHLFPFQATEPDKSRNAGQFPLGQCAESVTCARILKLVAGGGVNV